MGFFASPLLAYGELPLSPWRGVSVRMG